MNQVFQRQKVCSVIRWFWGFWKWTEKVPCNSMSPKFEAILLLNMPDGNFWAWEKGLQGGCGSCSGLVLALAHKERKNGQVGNLKSSQNLRVEFFKKGLLELTFLSHTLAKRRWLFCSLLLLFLFVEWQPWCVVKTESKQKHLPKSLKKILPSVTS